MGAALAERVAAGKTAAEAFAHAQRDAQDYSGHQEGYSGDLNSGGWGFSLVALPPRMTYRKLQALLEDYDEAASHLEIARMAARDYRPGGFHHGRRGWKGNLRKAEAQVRQAEKRLARIIAKTPPALAPKLPALAESYTDKWGDYLAVELRGAEAKSYNRQLRRGERLYIFFGYAPC